MSSEEDKIAAAFAAAGIAVFVGGIASSGFSVTVACCLGSAALLSVAVFTWSALTPWAVWKRGLLCIAVFVMFAAAYSTPLRSQWPNLAASSSPPTTTPPLPPTTIGPHAPYSPLTSSPTPIPRPEHSSVPSVPKPTLASDPLVSIDCHLQTRDAVSMGNLHVLQLWPNAKGQEGYCPGGLAEYFSTKGEVRLPFLMDRFPSMYRCHLVNYGDAPLFDVRVGLHALFREAVKDGASLRSGRTMHECDFPLVVPKPLEPSRDRGFEFYVVNQSDMMVMATLRDAASAESRDAHTRTPLAVKRNAPATVGMSFLPRSP